MTGMSAMNGYPPSQGRVFHRIVEQLSYKLSDCHWARKTTEPSELSRKESSISLPRKAGPKSCTTRFTIYPRETSHLLIPSARLIIAFMFSSTGPNRPCIFRFQLDDRGLQISSEARQEDAGDHYVEDEKQDEGACLID